jgi:hypothetical protein
MTVEYPVDSAVMAVRCSRSRIAMSRKLRLRTRFSDVSYVGMYDINWKTEPPKMALDR